MMDLRKAFQNLPQPAQNWLTSDSVTAVIIDINKRLDLEGELLRILPTVILRLVVKDVKPENFIPELSKELDIDFNQASAIAKDIEEKILRKIETILRTNVGVDTKLIYTSPTPLPIPRPEGARLAPPLSGAAPTSEQPYIIYEEKPGLRETPRPEPPKLSEVKIPIKTQPPAPKPAPPAPPVPPAQQNTRTRSVHYSNLRTPLS